MDRQRHSQKHSQKHRPSYQQRYWQKLWFLWGVLGAIALVGLGYLGPWSRDVAPTALATTSLGSLYNPPPGDVRIAVISDLNSAYGSTDYEPEVDRAIALLPSLAPDVVVCGGDMVAGQRRSLTTAQIQAMWAAFDRRIAAPLRRAGLPFGITIGNHDGSSARNGQGNFTFQQDRDLAHQYWNAPAHHPGLDFVDRYEFPFYYTFRQGEVFFLVWDGSGNRIPADKLAWVESALSSPAARTAKVRIALGHLPLYGVAVGRSQPGEVMHQGDTLRSLLERYDVHTYISGHQHAYYPGHRGNLQLLHTGALGGGPRRLIDSDRPPIKTLTLIDVTFDHPDLTTYTTYNMATMAPMPLTQLPRFLAGFNGLVLRRDLTAEDLTAAERQQCHQRLGASLCRA